jgi:hypothetical protein
LALLLLESKDRCGDDFRGELFDLILDQRAADMVDIRSGASGLLVRDYKGKEADRLVPAATPAWSRWSPNCTATSGGPPRNRSGGRRNTRSVGPSPHRRRRLPWL